MATPPRIAVELACVSHRLPKSHAPAILLVPCTHRGQSMLQSSQRGAAGQLHRSRWSARAAPSGARAVVVPRASAAPDSSSPGAGQANAQVLESFFIGRAFAITLSRRLGEAVVDVVSEVSKLVAENPKRMAEFQEEVMALARQEMQESEVPSSLQLASSSGGGGSSSSSSSGGASGGGSNSSSAAPATTDLQAIVDDLRAEVASARAELQQLRAAMQASAELN